MCPLQGNTPVSLVAQMVKRLPTMRETGVQSLGWEDPLEKEMATHSSTLAWRTPWREEPGRLLFHGVTKSRTRLGDFTSLSPPVLAGVVPSMTPSLMRILYTYFFLLLLPVGNRQYSLSASISLVHSLTLKWFLKSI